MRVNFLSDNRNKDMSNAPEKPSIKPTTKPKFKFTQSTFAPNLKDSSSAPEGEAAASPAAPSKPKKAAPKPPGLRPSSLKASIVIAPPEPQTSTPAAEPSPSLPNLSKFSEPEPDAAPEAAEGVSFEEEKSGPSAIEMVNVGLQGIAAIAAIVFTVLAVLENMPFL